MLCCVVLCCVVLCCVVLCCVVSLPVYYTTNTLCFLLVFMTVLLIGLKLACEESKQDEKSLETLLDVQSACKIAVEILNDLLCFDKLESGILELHKHDVEVTPFINDCVNMFVSQAKEAGVSISILSENPSSSSSSSPCYRDKGFEMLPESLIEGDMVCMDKFKMDQVLRNLISNALKFTPRGGSVTVCATFVEGASPPTPIHSMGNRSTSTSTLKELGRVVHSRLLNLFRMSNIPFTSTRGNSSSRGNTYTNWGAHQSQSQSPIAYGFNCTQTEESQHDDREDVEDVESNSNSSISCTQYRALSNADWESIAATSQGRILQEHDNSNSQELHHSRIINGKLRIAVTDTGAGISVANQARLFKEVVQFNPEVLQAGGGSGLGLWITNSIVQMHAGTIKVISKGPGQGTSFIVEIDMQRSSSFVTSTNKQASTTCAGAGVECRVGIRSEDERNTGCKLSGIITSRSSTTTTSTSTSRSLSAEQSTGVNDTGVPLKSAAEAGVGNRMGIEVAFEEEYLRSKRGEGGTYNPSYKQSEGTSTLHPYYKQPLSLSPHAVADLPFSPFSPFAPLGSGQPTASGNGMQVKGTFAFPDTDPVQDPDPDPLAYDVLVVDDSGLNRKLLCRVLRASKYTCEEANDGLAAFEKVKAKMNGELGSKLLYDVILIDFVMPVMDGPTATKAIRALGYGGLILGLTGNTLDSDINYFIGCGADAVLAKPFDFSAFRSFMAEHEHDHYHDNSSA